MLALPAPRIDADKELQVVCGISIRRRRLEPAGHAFHAAHERPQLEGKRQQNRCSNEKKDGSDDEVEAKAAWRKKRKDGAEKRSALKMSPHLVGVDLYALLGLTENASAEQIKKQYRKMALLHHPDKQDAADMADDKPATGLSEQALHFVKIQEAYELLSDQTKRRQYDSSLDFDDSTPDEVDQDLGFFGTFAHVFQRNARWSAKHPVPELGDEKTDMAKVRKFYDFWFDFDSWRDFSMHDEYNLEESEFREERRWMERQNQKIRKKYQDAERRRVMRLVEIAEKLDPRIRAEREEKEARKREEKERRARAKQEEEETKRKAEEEKRRLEEEERARQQEQEQREKEHRKQQKEFARGLRQRLKKVVQSKCNPSSVEMVEVQDWCLSMEAQSLESLCQRLEAVESSEAKAVLQAELRTWHEEKAQEKEKQMRQREEAKLAKAVAPASDPGASATWSTDELGLLAKGLQKFPGGMSGRWGLITQLLGASGFPRTEQEVINKTKELSEGQSLRSMASKLTAQSQNNGNFQKATKGAQTKTMTTPLSNDATPKAEPRAVQPEADAAAPVAAVSAGVERKPAEAAAWTVQQQAELEQALQRYPASIEKNERWRLIAEAVPGKTRAQCVERFKQLREQVTKQRMS